MELSEASRYPELLGHIYLHAQVMEHLRGQPVGMIEAAADWYDNLYRPAVMLIRKHQVLDKTGEHSKRTECDLYLWLVEHLREIRLQYGEENASSFSDALVDYLKERKIDIPEDLDHEDDESVILSRTQAMRVVQLQKQEFQQRAESEDER
ncbi:MAG: hypothetical protein ACPG7F_21690 [Aggregatilineales bacterium]